MEVTEWKSQIVYTRRASSTSAQISIKLNNNLGLFATNTQTVAVGRQNHETVHILPPESGQIHNNNDGCVMTIHLKIFSFHFYAYLQKYIMEIHFIFNISAYKIWTIHRNMCVCVLCIDAQKLPLRLKYYITYIDIMI